jgi:hypothetical protein
MKFKKPKGKDIIGVLLIILLSTFVVISSIKSKKQRERLIDKRKYSICYTLGLSKSASMTFIKYEYYVNHKKYIDTDFYEDDRISQNARYYISFLPENPKINEVQWDMPVPKNITEPPPEGWDYPPELIPPSQK